MRWFIVNRNKKNKSMILIVVILFILVETNYSVLFNLFSNKENLFKYVCGTIFPLIAQSILYTYLSLKGNYFLPLIYKTLNKLVILLLPILPNLNWFITGSIGILSSVIIYILFQYKFFKERKDKKRDRKQFVEIISYSATIVLSVTLVSFMLGIFKYQPITILSNSMESTFSRGDTICKGLL